jgi:type IV pilus assembly protein PilE
MKQAGFTLIELMIVLVVLAVLLLVALPAYQDSVRKARRADGKSALIGLQLAQEKLRGSCRFYAAGLATADACGTDAASSTVNYSSTSSEGHYAISVVSASGNAFTIRATATGAQASDTGCTQLEIAFPAQTKTPADCWN